MVQQGESKVQAYTYSTVGSRTEGEIPVLSAGKNSMHDSSHVCDPLGQAPPAAVSARGTDLSEHAQQVHEAVDRADDWDSGTSYDRAKHPVDISGQAGSAFFLAKLN